MDSRPIYLGLILSTLTGTLSSCKVAKNESSSEALAREDGGKLTVIQDQIKSFNETQELLLKAQESGASGCEKLDLLWNKIVETKQPDNDLLPPNSVKKEVLTFGNGSAVRFWRAFTGWESKDGGSDIRPYENGTNNYIRLTHRYGVLAKLRFVVNKEAVSQLGYTGHYAEGSNCILGRLSSAVPTSVGDRFTPAFAAKFFVGGGAENQVLITQHDIGGQSSGTDYTIDPPKEKTVDNNYYKHNLSNRLSFEKGVYSGVGAFSRFFYTAQYFAKNVFGLTYLVDPRELSANHLAERNSAGDSIPRGKVKGPRFVWTVAPSREFKEQFGALASRDSDFRKHFLALNSEAKNGGVTIFKVYASDTWTYDPETDARLIGEFVTTSPFVVSEAADVRLFFKHAMQFHPIPENEGQPSPYTQDFPYSEWGDELFTSHCRLGVREAEVLPKNESDLDGTFIRDATVNPSSLRRDKDGSICIKNIIEGKIEEAITPYLKRL